MEILYFICCFNDCKCTCWKGDFIFIENLPENAQSIAVYDAMGKLIQKKNVEKNIETFRLHLDEKSQGLFIVKIITDYNSMSYKVMKHQ